MTDVAQALAAPEPKHGWNVMQVGQVGWHVVQSADGWAVTPIFGPEILSREIGGGAVTPSSFATREGGHGSADAPAYTGPDLQAQLAEARNAAREDDAVNTFYIDCEFDGHNGPLLSIAMVRGDGRGLHVKVRDLAVEDPWVAQNVLPILDSHHADYSWHVRPNEVGTPLRGFIGDCQNPTIIADSPVDISRFCRSISTGEDGGWHSTGYAGMTFVVCNVDCYPTTLVGAVQHNAWWDAMALRDAIRSLIPAPQTGEGGE